jgi:hypothetical protein
VLRKTGEESGRQGAGGRLAGAFQPRGSLWYQRRRLLQRLEDGVARQAAVIWLLMAVSCAPKDRLAAVARGRACRRLPTYRLLFIQRRYVS